MSKKFFYEKTMKYVNADNIKMLILCAPLLAIVGKKIVNKNLDIEELFDTSILISFIILLLGEIISKIVIRAVSKKMEDDVKLEPNYEKLVEKYVVEKEKMVSWNGMYMPEIVLYNRKHDTDIKEILFVRDSNNTKYNLPKQVADNSLEIFKAHTNSKIYNNINVRLNDLIFESDRIRAVYGFTTFFDSMLTNRAMDYTFKGKRTVREIYEPGPFIHNLSESKLSNHLGFNGFVELADGKIIFVQRTNDVSIGKGLWQQSVGASLKTKYCMNSKHELTVDSVCNAIRMEIIDELQIEVEEGDIDQTNIFAFYRDLVEGGKPQFLFYYKTQRYTTDSFEKNFKKAMSSKEKKKENEEKLIVDGEKFRFFEIDKLKKETVYRCDSIIYDGKTYKMMPSCVASILLLLQNYDIYDSKK